MDTTKTTATEDGLLTTTDGTETVTDSASVDSAQVDSAESDYTSQYDYSYSELEDLYEKYFSNTDTDADSLYSATTGYETTGDAAISSAITAVVSTITSVFLFVVLFTLIYRIYMAVTKYMIAKKMGRSTAFAVLSIFFWPIMAGILAFSKKKDGSENGTDAAPTTPEVEAQVTPPTE